MCLKKSLGKNLIDENHYHYDYVLKYLFVLLMP